MYLVIPALLLVYGFKYEKSTLTQTYTYFKKIKLVGVS